MSQRVPVWCVAALHRCQVALGAANHDLNHLLERRREALATQSAAAAGDTASAGACVLFVLTCIIVSFTWSCACGSAGDGTCPVCLELVEAPAITPCGHVFCKECIYEYLYQNSTAGKPGLCPTCRKPIEDITQIMTALSRCERAQQHSLRLLTMYVIVLAVLKRQV